VPPPTDGSGGHVVWVAHRLPGRTRLRFSPARLRAEAAELVRGALAELPGVHAVSVAARSSSLLCLHDETIEPATLEQRLADALAQTGPAPRPPLSLTASSVAREVARLFSAANRRVLATTEGRVDLGTLVTLGFMGAGALDVAARRELPAPPWFNLAWWGFRTFTTLEEEAIRAGREGGPSSADVSGALDERGEGSS
jgi:hypothetical protein